jgi:hypothetical protein
VSDAGLILFAHGLVQRSSLPLPEWLFAWAASAVLVVSFVGLAVLWPSPRFEHAGWRALPSIGRVLGSRPVELICGTIGVAVLVLVFAAFNPWRAIGRVLFWRARRPYPERLGRWPAAAGILIFAWIELASGWGELPPTLVRAALAYTAVTLGAMAVYGVDAWTRWGEAFSVYFNLFSRLSIFERRDGVVGVRPPLSGLPRLDAEPGTVGLVAVMIGTVTFDGLSQGRLWKDLAVRLNDGLASLGFSPDTTPKLAATLGLALGVALVAGFYVTGIEGARSVGGEHDAESLRESFAHTLVPIAMVYVAAHYLTFLLFEGQSIGYLASDPLGQGWDLLGTASAAIDYSLIGQNATWYLQVAFVALGHVAALTLAHDRALVLYGQAKIAVRSQYWMLGIMVGFTTLALWLLAQANV